MHGIVTNIRLCSLHISVTENSLEEMRLEYYSANYKSSNAERFIPQKVYSSLEQAAFAIVRKKR